MSPGGGHGSLGLASASVSAGCSGSDSAGASGSGVGWDMVLLGWWRVPARPAWGSAGAQAKGPGRSAPAGPGLQRRGAGHVRGRARACRVSPHVRMSRHHTISTGPWSAW